MTKDNDILIESFFAKARQQDIEDNGFSRRVMSRLPSRADRMHIRKRRISRLWAAFCLVLGIPVVILSRAGELLLTFTEEFLRALPAFAVDHIYYMPLFTISLVAAALALYRWLDSEFVI